ncbi:hypothetical protein C0J52_09181 [Blattella germanica]|nr:hypothetical protein C0J52_09181 [Blattella germanica]
MKVVKSLSGIAAVWDRAKRYKALRRSYPFSALFILCPSDFNRRASRINFPEGFIHNHVLTAILTTDELRTSAKLNEKSTSTDLVPTLLGMYDALIGRTSQAAERSMEEARVSVVTRPLSISSIASSSSSSSGTSSCSGGGGGRRLGTAPKSSAYLASIESLEDDSDDPESGGGGSGGGGKQRLHHQKPIGSRAERLKGGSGGSQEAAGNKATH